MKKKKTSEFFNFSLETGWRLLRESIPLGKESLNEKTKWLYIFASNKWIYLVLFKHNNTYKSIVVGLLNTLIHYLYTEINLSNSPSDNTEYNIKTL